MNSRAWAFHAAPSMRLIQARFREHNPGAGHSDLNLGYLGGKNAALIERIGDVIATMGLNASPYNCWMAERGPNTFDLRFKQAPENAHKLADFLDERDMVDKTHFPGLTVHPDHKLATSMISGGYGAMVNFVFESRACSCGRLFAGV